MSRISAPACYTRLMFVGTRAPQLFQLEACLTCLGLRALHIWHRRAPAGTSAWLLSTQYLHGTGAFLSLQVYYILHTRPHSYCENSELESKTLHKRSSESSRHLLKMQLAFVPDLTCVLLILACLLIPIDGASLTLAPPCLLYTSPSPRDS